MASMQYTWGHKKVHYTHIPSVDVAFSAQKLSADMRAGTAKAFDSILALRYIMCLVRRDLHYWYASIVPERCASWEVHINDATRLYWKKYSLMTCCQVPAENMFISGGCVDINNRYDWSYLRLQNKPIILNPSGGWGDPPHIIKCFESLEKCYINAENYNYYY